MSVDSNFEGLKAVVVDVTHNGFREELVPYLNSSMDEGPVGGTGSRRYRLCKIDQIDPGCFVNMKRLFKLNLQHNQLQRIDSAWTSVEEVLQRTGNNIDLMDAHVWTLPHGRAGPGLFRSASLPDMTSECMTVPDDPASCRALLAILQHSYCEIPDNIAAARRPLPALPHTYCEIPDHIASAQRPLPALPPTYEEIPDNIAAQRPVSVPSHTYWEIPDHAVCSVARPARNTRLTASCRPLPAALYFMQASKRSTPPIGHEFGTSMRAAAYGVPGKAKHNSVSMYSTWKVTGKGSQIIARPRSFPVLPNTYWPWPLPGEEPHNTQCRKPPVPLVPNTYWPWEIPVKTIQNAKRRRLSMPEEGLQNPSYHE
ncbi:hypothetical protein Bbelb_081150 [Branchiostoma belcheri]|nr:hypothetical protein Bbelb_081150 [Branchiostoma belcheri]